MVIESPTVRMSFGPNRTRPNEMPIAPISMTQIGTVTVAAIFPSCRLCRIAASGPMALATSFAP